MLFVLAGQAALGGLTATVAWEPDPDSMLGIVATVAVTSTGQALAAGTKAVAVVIDWGDNTAPQTATAGTPVPHAYAAAGAYTATAWPLISPDGRGQAAVAVKTHAPLVHVYADPDDDWRALLWVDEDADGTVYAIDWGDGTGQIIRRDPPPYPRVPHDYTTAGAYTATITDQSTKRATAVRFDAGQIGMLFEFPTSDHVPHLVAARMKVGASWSLDWGDGTPPATGTVPVNASLRTGHTGAMDPGVYTVTVTETVDGAPRRTARRELTIPSVFNLRMNVALSWRRTSAATRTIAVTPVQTPPDVICVVDFGDGTAIAEVAGGTTVEHEYVFPFPASGYLIKVDEDGGDGRHFSRLMGEPAYIGQAQLSAWTPRAVDLYVEGIRGDTNSDWYAIDWGDGHINDIGAVGAAWMAWHEYPARGDYTITVDGPGMAEPVQRPVTVPYYPTPVLNTVEDTTDPARMTTIADVQNDACGGPVTLRFGDDTPPATVAEVSQTPHQYPEPGTYTLIAVCDADPTARARDWATVPYGDVQTLFARVEPVEGSPMAAQVFIDDYTPGEAVVVNWGDGAAGQITPPVSDPHTYDFAGAYTVFVGYGDESETHEFDITIPWEA